MIKRIVYILLAWAIFLCLLHACNSSSSAERAPETVPERISYNFDIRPILSDKCFTCHGPDANKREAGLRLDIAEHAYKALKNSTSPAEIALPGNQPAYALVPGKPGSSEVYLRITTHDSSLLMPPPASNLRLTPHEIKLIEKWISQGAIYEKHWSFTPPTDPGLPVIHNAAWVKNEIDQFILHTLEQKNLTPNPEADKERLLKRVCLDLTGLPPGPEMMDQFLADKSANAYEKIVDQLMAQPAYGEKMAVQWLDLARYGDSHGYQDDNYRSQWPWRDWVIHAFNTNMPYDRFITWQLAGDMLPDATREQLLASGFNRNHKVTEEVGVIDEEYRVEYVTDRTNTFGKALMGVTMECAKCHDHKYDPFSQKEYYQLYAFFNNVKELGFESGVGGPETYAKKPLMEITDAEIKSVLGFINKPDTGKIIVSVMGERDTLRETHILLRGVYDAPGEVVQPATPAAILPFGNNYPKSRLGLAEWLFSPRNPLTARVYVNQLWEEFFGRGIVKTSGDFGMQGELPSHPALLDWLAVDFVKHRWDIKRLVKQLVMSATYRQSAVVSPEKLQADPANVLLARAPRQRIKAEFVRDLVLSSSGLLVKTIGGPSVKPYQPRGLWEAASSSGGMLGILGIYKQDHGEKLYRRGLYTFIKRTLPPPSMGIFDASNRNQCEVGRLKTNTPLQALVMMNDPTVLEAARVLAASLLATNRGPAENITIAFQRIVCRKPKDTEIQLLTKYYEEQLQSMQPATAAKLLAVGEYPLPDKISKTTLATLMQVIATIYNLEESITKS